MKVIIIIGSGVKRILASGLEVMVPRVEDLPELEGLEEFVIPKRRKRFWESPKFQFRKRR